MPRVSLPLALFALVGCGERAPSAAPAALDPAPSPAVVDASAPEPQPVEAPPPSKDSRMTAGQCQPDRAAAPGPAIDVAKLPRAGAVDGADGGISKKAVFSGTIYQRGTFALGTHDKLVVPANALVVEGAPAGTVEVFVGKHLGFAGHPPESMSAASVRRNMGLATKEDGTGLALSTYGEFDTRIEGKSAITLVLRVPAGLAVVLRHALFGDAAAAATWPNTDKPEPKEDAGRIGYWYAAVNPSPGWKAMPLQDDPQRVAQAAGPAPTLAPCR
jgi:hypothetical protein